MTAAMNPIAQAAQALAGKLRPASTEASGDARLKLAHTAAASQASKEIPAMLSVDVLASQLKKTLARKALLGSGASLIPLPLIDLAVDAVLLVNVFKDIHTAFGLTPAQIDALDTGKRHRVYAAIQFVGNRAIGKVVTAAVVKGLVKGIGLKLSAQQLTKAVPIAGQIASAALNYATLRHLIFSHIDDCVRVVKQAQS